MIEEEIEIDDEIDDDSVSMSYDIASYPSDLTLSGISQLWKDGDIKIPDYQREFVWTIKQSSLLIDSFLCGLPVPNVFLYVDENNRSIVIDGQQRILTIVFYIDGYFGKENHLGNRQVFRLSGLAKNSPYFNKKFVDLTEADQRKLKQSILRAINIKQLNPKGESTSSYHIFERLNTGGTPLKPQEIRNSVFTGEFSKQLRELNRDENWRKLLGKTQVDRHQKDVELILRIFSLSKGGVVNYEKPLREFMNVSMKENRNGSSQKVKNFLKSFPAATKKAVSELGEKPFRLRGPINVAALESIMCALVDHSSKLKKIDLSAAYKKLVANNEFITLTKINTTDVKTVQDRFSLVQKTLLEK